MFDTINTLHTITVYRPWGIDIPNYFWFTGSSAAAFILSSFAHVFGKKEYKPIAGFALLLAFVLLAAAPMNLIDDLKQPGRLFNFFLYGWENFTTSPMKWGVLLLLVYPILILFEALILYREFFAKNYEQSGKFIYKLACLGRTQLNDTQKNKDHKIGFILGVVGIPLALCVHGYTGYILGVVHSIPLWHTPLMPILFLASAMVSGTGLMIVILPIFQRFFTDFKQVDKDMISRLMWLLSWFIVIDLAIRFFWLTFAMPFNDGEKYIITEFFSLHFNEVLWIEYVLCLVFPMVVGFLPKLRTNLLVCIIAGVICAAGVWLFRWNTVIGGESMPKTSGSFLEYTPHISGQDSIIAVASNWGLFICLLCIVMAIFPWDKEMNRYYKKDNK
ncbi:protein NrfD [Campylobacter sputorum subsp. bubulus]|uniref:Protein NrfD n=1 Tax=Campylobacter sputorum subsp. sputorum TaxID=32024 RepID=A0A381DLH5_9BACT|nr:NrfD/PsrC family molybdoenzyme membrane anchor subunit [Campylobacter sputorum]ASM34654.1 tetrathionate reductase TtrABC, subunit C [Campylobacter sputorum aubsp. sputorum RM3237]KAB0581132.1 polysulfide reductase NrfD [Campylobacter sputorum subsp. sputorum]QEL04845.1 tetrathionate reductase TtrABC, subunit C [Campylobacter sputorum subsp. sputorum]SUX09857.1 protein NrfD [Campylobacter sputorum subsp. bubulus]SUX11331.1 protein NrfD [Campylobacter sputorum subsp. sputorum]